MSIVRDLFGPGTWGTGGNMVAWVICGVIGLGWLHAKEKARHLQKMAQAARHHAELLEQAAAHHDAAIALAEKQHQEHLDRADVHAAAIRAHVTAATPPPPAAPVKTATTRKGI